MTGVLGRPGRPQRARRRSRSGPRLGLLGLAVALGGVLGILAACGTAAPSTTPRPSATPAVDDSGGGGPLATPWLGNAVLGIEAMGVADGEIRKGINDFNAGVQNNDPALLLRAASGLAGVDVLLENVDRIEPYPPMAPFAAAYREAITAMSDAAKRLEAALEAGDGAATTAASRDLVASFTKYAGVQGELAEWVVQIPEQKRILVR
jgi:hypothetical protein